MALGRRQFLTLTAGASLLPRFSWSSPAGPRRGPAIKLGVASYSLRKLPLDKMIEACHELDVKYVNFKDMHMPMDPPEATEAARKAVLAAGLTIVGGGTITLKNDEAQVRRAFDYAKRAGFPLMVTAPEAASLDIVEKMVKEYGIKVAIHNHGPEDKVFPAPQDALKLLKGRDPRMGLCMDIGHATRAGADIVKAVYEARERLLDVHLKDLKVTTDKESQTEVGRGVLDIPGLFKALREIKFEGHANLEYEINAENPVAGMKESFAYMRGVIDGLDA